MAGTNQEEKREIERTNNINLQELVDNMYWSEKVSKWEKIGVQFIANRYINKMHDLPDNLSEDSFNSKELEKISEIIDKRISNQGYNGIAKIILGGAAGALYGILTNNPNLLESITQGAALVSPFVLENFVNIKDYRAAAKNNFF